MSKFTLEHLKHMRAKDIARYGAHYGVRVIVDYRRDEQSRVIPVISVQRKLAVIPAPEEAPC